MTDNTLAGCVIILEMIVVAQTGRVIGTLSGRLQASYDQKLSKGRRGEYEAQESRARWIASHMSEIVKRQAVTWTVGQE